jgi:hypothetical protein
MSQPQRSIVVKRDGEEIARYSDPAAVLDVADSLYRLLTGATPDVDNGEPASPPNPPTRRTKRKPRFTRPGLAHN